MQKYIETENLFYHILTEKHQFKIIVWTVMNYFRRPALSEEL